jgi:hypothetical protein
VRKRSYQRTRQFKIYSSMVNKITHTTHDDSSNFYLSNYRAVLSYMRDKYKITPVQAEFVIWARGYTGFSAEDAKTLFLMGNNIRVVINELRKMGIIVIKFHGSKINKIPYVYALSPEGKRMATVAYNMIETGKMPTNY